MSIKLFLYTVGFLYLAVLAKENNSYSGIITYDVSFNQNDDVQSEIKSSKFTSDILKNTFESLKSLKYELIFNRNESLYSLRESMSVDSKNSFYKSATRIAGNELIYLNPKENIKLLQKTFIGDQFLISDTLTGGWKVTSETKQIEGYICYKAQIKLEKDQINPTGKLITAWFTKDIPVSFGPKGYSGLPGLILELSENNLVFTCSDIVLTKKELEIKKLKGGTKISRTEYDKYVLRKIQEYGFEKN